MLVCCKLFVCVGGVWLFGVSLVLVLCLLGMFVEFWLVC